MTPTPLRHKPSPRRRGVAVAALTALLAPVSVLWAAPASAALSSPVAGATVSGLVSLVEGRGATSNCLSTPAQVGSRVQVDRVADGAVAHTGSRSGTGALTSTWDSVGQLRGEYRVRSFARDARASGFLNLGCTLQAETVLSDLRVVLENGAAVAVAVPARTVTGEALPVTVTTTVDGAGVAGRPLGGREVTVTVPDVGEAVLVTDGAGRASTVFTLPDLPAAPLRVSAEVTSDAAFAGRAGAATTALDRRTTVTRWEGDVRGNPGTTARLAGQVLDATPGSDRAGRPVPGLPLALRLGSFVDTAPTTGSGRSAALAPLSGPSRVESASASTPGDPVWAPSADSVSFFVGDVAAEPAPTQHGTVGGLTRLVGGLLGSTTSTVVGTTDALLGGGLLGSGLLTSVTDVLAVADAGLLHQLTDAQLTGALDLLLAEVADGVGRTGDPVDAALGQLLDRVGAATPLGELLDTVRFRWRAVVVSPDGSQRAREFGALIGVPEPLDVTGDGTPDVLANLTVVSGVGGLDLSGVDGALAGSLDTGGDPRSIVPRIEIARLPGAPAALPLSLQAVLALPGSQQEYRLGYDTRESNAPAGFRADLALGDDGVGVELASRSSSPLAVTGALVPAGSGDQRAGGQEQRFGLSFDPAPRTARVGLALGGGQDVAAVLSTDRPTAVGLSLVDDSGADELFVVDGALQDVDGALSFGVEGAEGGALRAQVLGDSGLDTVRLEGRRLAAGRTLDDLRLVLQDVPDRLDFALTPDGAGSLTSSAPIGMFEAGFASGGEIAQLDDPAYLHLLSEPGRDSVSLRLPGFEGLSVQLGDDLSLELAMAPTPLRALIVDEGLSLDASILDAPSRLALALASDGGVRIEGSAPIGLVTVAARDASGLLAGATDLDLRIEDVPGLLSISVEDQRVAFETGGEPVGLVEVSAHGGTPVTVPGGGDGLLLDQGPDGTAVAARITGLRTIAATLSDTPELLLDTVAEQVFSIALRSPDRTVGATIDHLVPDMRLRLVDDGSGALVLDYAASRATNSLRFDLGGLSGSIADPLPARLLICIAGDEACLPELGIEDPGLGSVRFAASEHTTVDLVDPSGGLSATGLRVRVLELTGDLDLDAGGDLYLNTTEYGGACGEVGCVHPVLGGRVGASLGAFSIEFIPGNGFSAERAITNLQVTRLFGQPTGVRGTGGTGRVTCVPETRLNGRVSLLGIPITLNFSDAICRTPRTG